MSRSNDDEAFQKYVTTLAEVAAARVDPDLHGRLRQPNQINGTDYERAVAPLRNLKQSVPAIHYIYTLVWDGHALRFILDTGAPGKSINGIPDQASILQPLDADPKPLLAAFGINVVRPAPVITPVVSDSWGRFVVAFAPILDSIIAA